MEQISEEQAAIDAQIRRKKRRRKRRRARRAAAEAEQMGAEGWGLNSPIVLVGGAMLVGAVVISMSRR